MATLTLVDPLRGDRVVASNVGDALRYLYLGWMPLNITATAPARISISGGVTLNPNAQPQPGFPLLPPATASDVALDGVLLSEYFSRWQPPTPGGGTPIEDLAITAVLDEAQETVLASSRTGDVLGARPVYLERGGEIVATKSYLNIGDLLATGWRILRDDHETYRTVQPFMGGELFDGHPLNVLLGLGWIAGQQEAIAPAVESGTVQEPTIDLTKTYRPGAMSSAAMLGLGVLAVFGLSRFTKKRG